MKPILSSAPTGRRRAGRRLAAALAGLALFAAACGDDATPAADGGDRPTVVVTTSILADVVEAMVGSQVRVIGIMPAGADPHDFQASARQVEAVMSADALVVNGAGFEEGLLDVIDAASRDGVAVYEAVADIRPLAPVDDGDVHDDDHDDDDDHHDDDDHGDDHHDDDDHDHGDGVDPHFFTDPSRMAEAARGILEFLAAELSNVDTGDLEAAAAPYLAELEELDAEVELTLATVPEGSRTLVTNHAVLAYFAERYEFDVVGTVVPATTTQDGVAAADLVRLARIIEQEGVRAVFADTSSPDDLARTLAAEVGDVDVVELYSESLGEPGSPGGTYVGMIRENARRIADALS